MRDEEKARCRVEGPQYPVATFASHGADHHSEITASPETVCENQIVASGIGSTNPNEIGLGLNIKFQ